MAIVNDKIAAGLRDVLEHFGEIPTGEFIGSDFIKKPEPDHYADAGSYMIDWGKRLESGTIEAVSKVYNPEFHTGGFFGTRNSDIDPDAGQTEKGARVSALNDIAAQIHSVQTPREMEEEGFGAW